MINLINPQYYWPRINKVIANYVKHCHTCQINKKCKQEWFGLIQKVPQTNKPVECLSFDTVGGFDYYNSAKKYLHLVVDHETYRVWEFPSKSDATNMYKLFEIHISNTSSWKIFDWLKCGIYLIKIKKYSTVTVM